MDLCCQENGDVVEEKDEILVSHNIVMRKCKLCLIEKELNEKNFPRGGFKKDNTYRLIHKCIKCYSAFRRNKYLEKTNNQTEIIGQLETHRTCNICNINKELNKDNFYSYGSKFIKRFDAICKICSKSIKDNYLNSNICDNKSCKNCKEIKNLKEFPCNIRHGKISHQIYCYDCINKKDRLEMHNGVDPYDTKKRYFVEIKDNKKVRICKICLIEKEISNFHKVNNDKQYKTKCIDCSRKLARTPSEQLNFFRPEFVNQKWYRKCKICFSLKEMNNNNYHYSENKKIYSTACKLCIQEKDRQDFQKNKKNVAKQLREKRKDPIIALRHYMSCAIRSCLEEQNGSKNNQSFLKYVNWTPIELKKRVEKLFSHPDNLTPDGNVWMNWNNRGVFKVETWNDNDPSTWVWNLDHIIPKTNFIYISMSDEAFKKCWELDNFRPLSAKQNIFEGSNRKNPEIIKNNYKLWIEEQRENNAL